MNGTMSAATFDEYLRLLDKRSEPTFNDRTYPQYVNYMNGFLRHLGTERIYLVGSTTERLKLRWSKDGGDSDFLLLSGKLEVPVENVEFRSDTPCIIWVKVDRENVDRNIDLIENKYLPSDVLRSVGPELFTAIRGLYLIFTGNASYMPREKHVTSHGITSKVGLSMTNYNGLKIDNRNLSTERTFPKRHVIERDEEFKKYIERRKRESSFRKQDIESIRTALQFVSYTKIPGSVGEGLGYWEHFAYISGLVLERLDSFKELSTLESPEVNEVSAVHRDEGAAEDKANSIFVNDFESLPAETLEVLYQRSTTTLCDSERLIRNIRATFTERTSKDFVPAIRLVGKLPCMEIWKHAEHRWLAPGEIEAIYSMDVFFVARYAPVNPRRKDFCLSFTLAENKLSECLSPVQRRVVLVMKAYLKGVITKLHKEQGRDLRLTTFHLKTIVYRVCDITEPVLWSEDNILSCIVKIVEYLKTALLKKELLHYFIESNLFAAFDNEDCKLLLDCVEDILTDPVGSIKPFFDQDDGIPNEIWLTEEEVRDLEKLTTDGGISKEVDRLEEALVEILRGLNEGPRDAQGNAPIQKAISTSLELYFKDTLDLTLKRAMKRWNLGAEADGALTTLLPLLSESLGSMLGESPDVGNMFGGIARLFEPFSNETEKQQTFDRLKYLVVSHFGRGEDD